MLVLFHERWIRIWNRMYRLSNCHYWIRIQFQIGIYLPIDLSSFVRRFEFLLICLRFESTFKKLKLLLLSRAFKIHLAFLQRWVKFASNDNSSFSYLNQTFRLKILKILPKLNLCLPHCSFKSSKMFISDSEMEQKQIYIL